MTPPPGALIESPCRHPRVTQKLLCSHSELRSKHSAVPLHGRSPGKPGEADGLRSAEPSRLIAQLGSLRGARAHQRCFAVR